MGSTKGWRGGRVVLTRLLTSFRRNGLARAAADRRWNRRALEEGAASSSRAGGEVGVSPSCEGAASNRCRKPRYRQED